MIWPYLKKGILIMNAEGRKGVSFISHIDQQEKRLFFYCQMITVAVGLIAHAYVYCHDAFSHDSLGIIYATISEDNWEIALGRWLSPIYRALTRGRIASPWIVGLLTLFWIGLSVYFIVKIFDVKSRLVIFLLSGSLVANLTVTALAASFIFQLDSNMFALLLATIAAYFWKKFVHGWIPGILFVAGALGIYQSYFSVTITLIIFASILSLLRGTSAQQIFFKGLKGIAMLLGGGFTYVIGLKIKLVTSGIGLVNSYNGLTNMFDLTAGSIYRLIGEAYKDWVFTFLSPQAAYMGKIVTIVNTGFLCLLFIAVIVIMCTDRMNAISKGLFLLLLALMPLGMNISFVLSGGLIHVLMRYSFWLFYPIVLILIYELHPIFDESEHLSVALLQGVAVLFSLIVLWNNVQVSNAVYLKKDLEEGGTFSLMTRVIVRLEEIPEYIPGESPVVFVGAPSLDVLPGFEKVSELTGAQNPSVITYNTVGMYEAYLSYILNTSVALDYTTWGDFQTDPRVAEMPVFPYAESIQKLDGVFVVKMGN